jgi:hypothetical protein
MDTTLNISTTWLYVITVLAIWDLAWRGVALWKASKKGQNVWFIVLLVINSVGLLPIAYILLNKGEKHD